MAQRPVVARDFLGIGNLVSGDAVIPKQNLSPGARADSSVPPLLTNMSGPGIESSAWSKAVTMQHFRSLRGSPDDRFKEQIAENLPEKSFLRIVHPLQMQDLSASHNQKNGFCIQEDSLMNSTAQVREESGCSKPILGGFWSSSSRTNMISLSTKLEAKAVHGVPAASEMRLPSSGITDMEHDPSLTIFYAGSVKVFNNISAEQAEAIMILASGSNGQGNPVDPAVAATRVAIKSINGRATLIPNEKSPMNLHSQQAVENQQTNANKVNPLATNMHLDFENLRIPVPSSPNIAAAQSMVPTALPHARKASLARFLEKRRERAHSKCPYPVKREDSFLPEERLSSSNDPCTCYSTPRSSCVDKKLKSLNIPTWMERVTECSASDMGSKEQNL